MKMKNKPLNIIYFLLLFTFFTCKDNDPCSDIACTTELRAVFVHILDQNDNPTALDGFQVTNTNDNSNVTISLTQEEFQFAQQNGRYPLIDDLGIGTNETLELRFVGIVGSSEVVNELYTVNSDCCHISTVFGRIRIVLE